MSMPALPAFYSREMVLALPDDGQRYETVHGELLVTPSPRLRHQDVLARLHRTLAEYVERHGLGKVLFSPADISWGPDILVQPDLFVIAPETKAMFSDIDAQRDKLRDELASLAHLIRNLDQLQIEAAALGARHRGYGVRAAHYRLARNAMETALAETLGDRFGPAERDAWRQAYDLIAELMQG